MPIMRLDELKDTYYPYAITWQEGKDFIKEGMPTLSPQAAWEWRDKLFSADSIFVHHRFHQLHQDYRRDNSFRNPLLTEDWIEYVDDESEEVLGSFPVLGDGYLRLKVLEELGVEEVEVEDYVKWMRESPEEPYLQTKILFPPGSAPDGDVDALVWDRTWEALYSLRVDSNHWLGAETGGGHTDPDGSAKLSLLWGSRESQNLDPSLVSGVVSTMVKKYSGSLHAPQVVTEVMDFNEDQ